MHPSEGAGMPACKRAGKQACSRTLSESATMHPSERAHGEGRSGRRAHRSPPCLPPRPRLPLPPRHALLPWPSPPPWPPSPWPDPPWPPSPWPPELASSLATVAVAAVGASTSAVLRSVPPAVARCLMTAAVALPAAAPLQHLLDVRTGDLREGLEYLVDAVARGGLLHREVREDRLHGRAALLPAPDLRYGPDRLLPVRGVDLVGPLLDLLGVRHGVQTADLARQAWPYHSA
mmetsp:Transcript_37295/g.116092  ORF Transcript_37295/g.116092 Transcript_37295/m.116092 type:complete len:233 (+) Transcript_37295:245-943(+)